MFVGAVAPAVQLGSYLCRVRQEPGGLSAELVVNDSKIELAQVSNHREHAGHPCQILDLILKIILAITGGNLLGLLVLTVIAKKGDRQGGPLPILSQLLPESFGHGDTKLLGVPLCETGSAV